MEVPAIAPDTLSGLIGMWEQQIALLLQCLETAQHALPGLPAQEEGTVRAGMQGRHICSARLNAFLNAMHLASITDKGLRYGPDHCLTMLQLCIAVATGQRCIAVVKADISLLHVQLQHQQQVATQLGRCRVDTLGHLRGAPAARRGVSLLQELVLQLRQQCRALQAVLP